MTPATTARAVRTNRRAWDVTVRRHRQFRGDEAALLARGGDPADLTALGGLMRREIGDLAGRDVLHVMCNHGAVTIALARGARSVRGVDFSDDAVREARALAVRTGSAATFECAEVLRFLGTTRRRFDAVVAAWGVTCWVPDLRRFARGVARVLRPGGFVHLLDGHPMANTALGVGAPGDGYFAAAGAQPRRERWAFDYYGPGRGRPVDIAWWQWPLGDVVTAFCDAGLVIEFVHEFAGTHPRFYGTAVAVDVTASGDAATLPGRRGVLPLAFSLRARRSATPAPPRRKPRS